VYIYAVLTLYCLLRLYYPLFWDIMKLPKISPCLALKTLFCVCLVIITWRLSKKFHFKICLLIPQEKIFSVWLTCTWLKKMALVGNNVLILTNTVHDRWLGKCVHMLKLLHQKSWVATVSFIHCQALGVKNIPNALKNGVRQGCEDCKFYKIKTNKLKDFQCTLWQNG
jgi:hypothetical protein